MHDFLAFETYENSMAEHIFYILKKIENVRFASKVNDCRGVCAGEGSCVSMCVCEQSYGSVFVCRAFLSVCLREAETDGRSVFCMQWTFK